MTEIIRWQLLTHLVSITKPSFATAVTVDGKYIWTEKDKDGKTHWEKLKEFAADGWELVSVTAIVTAPSGSQTYQLLYTFKRPIV